MQPIKSVASALLLIAGPSKLILKIIIKIPNAFAEDSAGSDQAHKKVMNFAPSAEQRPLASLPPTFPSPSPVLKTRTVSKGDMKEMVRQESHNLTKHISKMIPK